MRPKYQIGEVAERADLSLRTVRYYEEMGLITPESRTEGGFRIYTDDQVERLLLIKKMKPLGFTVEEMGELLAARDRIASKRTSDSTRSAAAETLRRYSDDAALRLDQMRNRLEQSESLVEQLAAESGRRPAH